MVCRIIPLFQTDFNEIVELWETSVKVTHHFLQPEEINFYKPYILKYTLPLCRLLGIKETDGRLAAFIGLSEDKTEMLFVHPDYFNRGYGSKLITFAEHIFGINKVDVNEENPRALNFYLHIGYKIIGRSEIDGNGKPHPLLFLEKQS